MKKLITFLLAVSMTFGSISAVAAEKGASAPTKGYEISLSAYNLRSDGTKSADVTVTKDGEPYTGGIQLYVDGTPVSGTTVSSTSEGIHKVTAEVDGETLTTYFAYVHQYGACAVKDTTPVFFEDFEDDDYDCACGDALIKSAGGFTGSSGTSSFKATDGNVGNRPNNTALQFHTTSGQAFQTDAFGPELADYMVEYYFRGQSYSGSAATAIGINLGLRYSPTEEMPFNAYRIIYAPYGKRNGNSCIATSGASRIWDVLAIGRTGKSGLKNGMPGYWLSGIQTSSANSGQSYTSTQNEATIQLGSKYEFVQNMFYKMSAYAFSNTVAAQTINPITGETLRKVNVDISNDYNIQTGDGANKTTISKGRTVLGAQEYIYRVDDIAIYKLYNCKNIYQNLATATEGVPAALSVYLNGVDNNDGGKVVNYYVNADQLNIYNDGLNFTVDKAASTVTFTKDGKQIVPIEYVGANGVKKGIIAAVNVEPAPKFEAAKPIITVTDGVIKAQTNVSNTTDTERSAVLYLALYSDDVTLAAVEISEMGTFSQNDADTLTAELRIPEDYDENTVIKAFVWEDMMPLAEAAVR